jgi:hypothetical protein
MEDQEKHDRRIQAYIDEVGVERYTIECMIAHLTDVERNRLLLDLPRQARECVARVVNDAEPS